MSENARENLEQSPPHVSGVQAAQAALLVQQQMRIAECPRAPKRVDSWVLTMDGPFAETKG
jgi:hypothetical protein